MMDDNTLRMARDAGVGYALKDSGHRREFSTGAVRDRATGKGRPDLISPIALERLGKWMEKGAEKYGEWNWEAGMPLSEYLASAFRHLISLLGGRDDEDHAAALMFNAQAFIHTHDMIRRGHRPADLDDIRWGLLDEVGQGKEVEVPKEVDENGEEFTRCRNCGGRMYLRESRRLGECINCRGGSTTDTLREELVSIELRKQKEYEEARQKLGQFKDPQDNRIGFCGEGK